MVVVLFLLLNTLLLVLNVVHPHPAEHQAEVALAGYLFTSSLMLAANRALRTAPALARTALVLGLGAVFLWGVVLVPFGAERYLRDRAERMTRISDLRDRPLLIDGQPAGIEVMFRFTPRGLLWVRDAYRPIGRLDFVISPPMVNGQTMPGNYVIGLQPREIEVTPSVGEWKPYQADTTYEVRVTAVPDFLGSIGDSFCLKAALGLDPIERHWKAITEQAGAVQFSVNFEAVDPTAGSYSSSLWLKTERRYDVAAIYAAAVSLSGGMHCPPNMHGGTTTPF